MFYGPHILLTPAVEKTNRFWKEYSLQATHKTENTRVPTIYVLSRNIKKKY